MAANTAAGKARGRQHGFSYLLVLLMIAMAGVGMVIRPGLDGILAAETALSEGAARGDRGRFTDRRRTQVCFQAMAGTG